MKLAETSVATALAKSVLPVPGGPKNKTPFVGANPNFGIDLDVKQDTPRFLLIHS